jgi:hypothetical protein
MSEVQATQARCHWCNRPISSDELIVLIVPNPDDSIGPDGKRPPAIVEQNWHTVCFSMIQGLPAPDDE